MGPKKSPSSKKKGSSSKKKEEASRQEAEVEENELEFQIGCLDIRVKELETLNAGLQAKCAYVDSQNSVYKTQLQECKEERNDMVGYMERCLSEERTISRELEDRLIGTQEARKEDNEEFAQRLLTQAEEFEAIKLNLDKMIAELNEKLASIEEFRLQKVELTYQMEALRTTLADERSHFTKKFDQLENQTIVYREKLKMDACDTLIKIAEDVREAGKKSLSCAVKAAIASNVKLNQELETVSKDNLILRDKLDKKNAEIKEFRLTIEALEEQNIAVQRKCLQYKNALELLLNKQIKMDTRIKSVNVVEDKLKRIQNEHVNCKSEEEISILVKNEIIKQSKSLEATRMESSLGVEVKKLQDVIIKMAIVAKDLTEAENDSERKFLRDRFKAMLVKLYEFACDIKDMPEELKSRLVVQLPQISTSNILFWQ